MFYMFTTVYIILKTDYKENNKYKITTTETYKKVVLNIISILTLLDKTVGIFYS